VNYPQENFLLANELIVQSFEKYVVPNEDGVSMFVTAIDKNTFAPTSSINHIFTIPAIPDYPKQPTPIPTYPPINPVIDGATATAVAKQDNANTATYQQAVQAINATVASTKTHRCNRHGSDTHLGYRGEKHHWHKKRSRMF
jgi:hypothetical protein